MDVDRATSLLGGLSPRQFMRRHWQKTPLLVRGAIPGVAPPLARAALFALVADDGVESRLIVRDGERWTLRHGPLPRRALPPLARPGWTLLVQGLDLHADAARVLLDRFRFVADARLDDLMVSFASDGGGVGAHVDSYDVFLLQVQGQRRWRVSSQRDLALRPGVPLRLLENFRPEAEWLLDPGDLLYLPPRWAHEGVAVGGDCMTCSIGARAPSRGDIAQAVLQRALDVVEPGAPGARYRDAGTPATGAPGRIPGALARFAAGAVARFVADGESLACALGETLTEPKATVRFEPGADADTGADPAPARGVRLDRRSRMLYDDRRIYLNGESYLVRGRDAAAMRRLADRRRLDAAEVRRLSADARETLADWLAVGWAHRADGATGAAR